MTPDQASVALVANDDPSVRRLCRVLLEKEGWHVREAGDGAEAVALAVTEPPHVVIMDAMMPGLDGVQATRRFRAEPATADVPIVILSAHQDTSDVIAALEAGADEYLMKPIITQEFATRIRVASQSRRAWREQRRTYDILGEQARSVSLLLDFTCALSRMEELESVLVKTIEVAATLAACRRVSILLPDARQRELRLARSIGLEGEFVDGHTIPMRETITGWVFVSNRPMVVNNESEARGLPETVDRRLLEHYPATSMPMHAAEQTVGILNVADRISGEPFSERDEEYLSLLCSYAASAIENLLIREARDEARDSIVTALAKLAEHRDNDTGKHVERVTSFSLLLAKELQTKPEYADKIDADFLRNLQRAAPLHDIGKVAIPDAILLKPGRLTETEMAVMRTHVAVGVETIQSVLADTPNSGFLKTAEEIISGHHEWFDGTGYPNSAHGEDIPFSARILAVADVYDALTTKRVYKEATPHSIAAGIILDESGTHFDPDIVAAFVKLAPQFERLADRLCDLEAQDSGETPDGLDNDVQLSSQQA